MHAPVSGGGLVGIVRDTARNRGVFAAAIGAHGADAMGLRPADDLGRDIGPAAAEDAQRSDPRGHGGILQQPLQKRRRPHRPGASFARDQCGGLIDVPDVQQADLAAKHRADDAGIAEAGDVGQRRAHEQRILRAKARGPDDGARLGQKRGLAVAHALGLPLGPRGIKV